MMPPKRGIAITEVLVEDVLRMILDNVADLLELGILSRIDVLSLAETSKYFYYSALPFIYRTISLDCHLDKVIYDKTWACCSSLAKHLRVAAFVKTFIVKDSFGSWDAIDHFPKQWKSVILPALGNMVNLRELRWSCCSFSPALWNAVCSLNSLESLYLARCSVRTSPSSILKRRDKKAGQETARHLYPPHLTTLGLVRVNTRHGDDAPVLEMLDKLLSSNRFESLVVDRLPHLSQANEFLKNGQSNLKRIWLSNKSDNLITLQYVFDILQACPSLVDVGMAFYNVDEETQQTELPPTALPSLSSFSGNHWLASRFVSGRAVRKVLMDATASDIPFQAAHFNEELRPAGPAALISALAALQHSLVPVLHLELIIPDMDVISFGDPSAMFKSISGLPSVCPSLRVLRIFYSDSVPLDRKMIHKLSSIVEQFEDLQEVAFTNGPPSTRVRSSLAINLLWQGQVVKDWSMISPHLHAIQLSSLIQWHYELGRWNPVLLGLGGLHLLEETVQFQDYNNCPVAEYDWQDYIRTWLNGGRPKVDKPQRAVARRLGTAFERLSFRTRSKDGQIDAATDATLKGVVTR